MKFGTLILLILLVATTFSSTVHASWVMTIEVGTVEGLTNGDFARIVFDRNDHGKNVQRTIVDRTRVQIVPVQSKGKIGLRLPCISAEEMRKLDLARQVGTLHAEMVEKGPSPDEKKSILELIPDSRGITNGWCATPQSGAAQP